MQCWVTRRPAGNSGKGEVKRGMKVEFHKLLKKWRKICGMTQFDLSMVTGFSQKHLSFLECGHTNPSRNTILVLSEALSIPLRVRNSLLNAAGYAEIYDAEPLDSEKLQHILQAFSKLLDELRPFPAVLIDKEWNIVRANRNAGALFTQFAGTENVTGNGASNIMRSTFEKTGLRPYISNWPQYAQYYLMMLRLEMLQDESNEVAKSIIEDFSDDPEIVGAKKQGITKVFTEYPGIVLELKKDDMAVKLFTLESAYSAPQDVTVSELKIETFVPADEPTRLHLEEIDNRLKHRGHSEPFDPIINQ